MEKDGIRCPPVARLLPAVVASCCFAALGITVASEHKLVEDNVLIVVIALLGLCTPLPVLRECGFFALKEVGDGTSDAGSCCAGTFSGDPFGDGEDEGGRPAVLLCILTLVVLPVLYGIVLLLTMAGFTALRVCLPVSAASRLSLYTCSFVPVATVSLYRWRVLWNGGPAGAMLVALSVSVLALILPLLAMWYWRAMLNEHSDAHGCAEEESYPEYDVWEIG